MDYIGYELQQYSLSNYKLINNDNQSLSYRVYKFEYGEETEIMNGDVASGNNVMLEMPNDGIFIIRIYQTLNHVTPFVTYVVHNIMDILGKRQSYLTTLLKDADLDNCQSKTYYDYISFNTLFQTYIYLVEKLMIGKTENDNINIVPSAIPDNLYKVEDIYNKLMEYV